MSFVARLGLLQKKCQEQHQSLFLPFIDLTKALDTVNRDLLWKVLSKFGCPPHFLHMLRAFGMSARVTVGGHESDPFDVSAAVLNNAVSWLPSSSTYFWSPLLWSSEMDSLQMLEFPSTSGWMAIYSISDGCSLQAKTKVSPDTIFDFQYADDAAIPSHTAVGLQHSLDLLAATYQRAGLIVNIKKTEVLPQSVNTSSAAHPTFTVHGDSLNDVHQFLAVYLPLTVV